MNANKPLGIKSYGSIPHLPGSRMGPGDHHCHEGQARICTTEVRDRHDKVIVQEKLDGSCVAVAKIAGEIVPLGRAGYLASSSPYPHIQHFAAWALMNRDRFDKLLAEGERVVGEWMGMAVGTKYKLVHEPFAAFDIIKDHERLCCYEFMERVNRFGFVFPIIIAAGPTTIDLAMNRVILSGHGALEPVEGCVWRVERKGRVDFLCKYVRPDKIDGKYLPKDGEEGIYYWRPDAK